MILRMIPCLDSEEMAGARRRELDIRRDIAAELGRSAVSAADNGFYFNPAGEEVVWRHLVDAARARKRSIAPQEPLPKGERAALVFCESGLGRTSCMGAAYWIAKGLSASDAIARMSEACGATDWATQERQRVLTEYERSMKG